MNIDREVEGAPPNRERRCKATSGHRNGDPITANSLSIKFTSKVIELITTNQLEMPFELEIYFAYAMATTQAIKTPVPKPKHNHESPFSLP